jgi:hypothetical protein
VSDAEYGSFDSRKEYERWNQLLLLEKAGHIRDLQRQRKYELYARRPDGDMLAIGGYVADFVYLRGEDVIIEDVKGFRTQLYRWKKKHFEAQTGFAITET